MPVTSLVARYDHILLDLDGCVWVGDEPTAGAVEAVAALRAAGKNLAFVTNDSQLATEDYVRKLWRLGFQASLEEVVTVGGALQYLLAERFAGGSAVVIGSPALHRHVEAAGLRVVNATAFASRADVVVVAFHPDFHYAELRDATQAALRGAVLVGSNRDATFPQSDGLWPGSGSIIAAVETASGRTVQAVGKPEPTLVRTALDRLGGGRALMVGDRVDADLGAAHAAGIDGAVVLTGASTREIAEAATDPRPVAIAERLEDPRRRVSLQAKIAVARAAGSLSRRSGRGGTSLPGKLLMRLEPHAMSRLAARLRDGCAVISATNGKTTTAAMVAAILEGDGARLVHNRAGANMAGGVATALLGAARGSSIDGDAGLFEVDEFWLDRVVPELRPRAVLLSNLFRDQLDRYGELETIADRWAAALAAAPTMRLALNADDPLVADLGRDRVGVTYFGVQDDAVALAGMSHAADSKHCRRCGTAYVYDAVYMSHLGRYHCPNGDGPQPVPDVWATDVVLDGTSGASFTLHVRDTSANVALPLPGLYNVYNALAAAALAHALGAGIDAIVAGLQATRAAFGRAETVQIAGRELAILLVKNPAGANEVLRTLALDPGEHDVFAVLNDRTADGHDVSWVWDADFELVADRVRRVVCSGTRAAELAVRLKYAGVPDSRLRVVPALADGLDAALADGDGRLVALPTYTAMLDLRALLVARGAAEGSFR